MHDWCTPVEYEPLNADYTIAEPFDEATGPIPAIGQILNAAREAAADIVAEHREKESPTDHAARMARESFEDAAASMSSDTLRAIIEKYDAADRDTCRNIVAEVIEHGNCRNLVNAAIVAMHAELQRRAGK